MTQNSWRLQAAADENGHEVSESSECCSQSGVTVPACVQELVKNSPDQLVLRCEDLTITIDKFIKLELCNFPEWRAVTYYPAEVLQVLEIFLELLIEELIPKLKTQ